MNMNRVKYKVSIKILKTVIFVLMFEEKQLKTHFKNHKMLYFTRSLQ